LKLFSVSVATVFYSTGYVSIVAARCDSVLLFQQLQYWYMSSEGSL